MNNYLSILTATVLFVAVSCQPQSQQSKQDYKNEVKQKIAELDKLYFEAWQNEELDSTMTFLDDDFINMFSFGPSQTKEECIPAFKAVMDTYSIEDVEFKSTELIIDQNYAFETGLFKQKWITNDKKDTIKFDMRGLTVFKKQPDESWKMFRLIAQQ